MGLKRWQNSQHIRYRNLARLNGCSGYTAGCPRYLNGGKDPNDRNERILANVRVAISPIVGLGIRRLEFPVTLCQSLIRSTGFVAVIGLSVCSCQAQSLMPQATDAPS